MLRYLSNYNNKHSLSIYFRKKRFKLFLNILKNKTGNKILDIGGFANSLEIFDNNFTDNNDITILNIEKIEVQSKTTKFILGDATNSNLFASKSFDIVHCNSVIEHLNTFELQKILSSNIQKWGNKYFVQTPNYYFPFEPHFLVPFFHFFPSKFRVYLLTKFNLGHFPREKDIKNAEIIVSSIRLLKYGELSFLFPEGKIIKEKFLFFTKSFIIHNFD